MRAKSLFTKNSEPGICDRCKALGPVLRLLILYSTGPTLCESCFIHEAPQHAFFVELKFK